MMRPKIITGIGFADFATTWVANGTEKGLCSAKYEHTVAKHHATAAQM